MSFPIHYLSTITITLILTFTSTHLSANEKLNCRSGDDEYSDSLSLEIDKGKVRAFNYFSTAQAFSCDVSARRGDKNSNWSYADSGKTTKVSFQEGSVLIKKIGNAYSIQFIDVSHMYHCGMGGQMADQVIITHGKKECEVR